MNHTNLVIVLSALLVLSETLGGIQAVQANSIYQVFMNVFKMIYQLLTGQVPPSAPKAA